MSHLITRDKKARQKLTTVTLPEFSDSAKYLADELDGQTYMHVSGHGERKDWFGVANAGDVTRVVTEGDLPTALAAEAILDKINTALDLEMCAPLLDYSPAGGCVSVARFLAGAPNCMSRLVEVEGEHAPVRVFVGTACSQGVEVEAMNKRNMACLALAMALSRVRPVELWAYALSSPSGAPDVCIMTRLGTSPLDLAAATGALSITYARAFAYRIAQTVDSPQGATAPPCHLGWSSIPEAVAVGATGDDVVVPQVRYDEADAIVRDPVAWVETRLRQALAGEGTAHKSGY